MEHRLILGGGRFLPFARGCVAKLKRAGLAYASQSYEIDGVSISVRIEPGNEYIRLIEKKGYMESGVLDLHDVQLGERATYRPATIKFTPLVSDYTGMPYELPNAWSRKVKDGDDSWSASGCEEKTKAINTLIGAEKEIHFDSDPAEFCDADKMKVYKRLMERVPASTYTGKLKAYVQALYGSKRTDYRGGGLLGAYIEVSTGKFTVPPEGSQSPPREIYAPLTNGYPTHGLLTVPSNEGASTSTSSYVLVDIGVDSVKYRHMMAQGIEPTLGSDTPADIIKLAEAYRLSTLVPSDVELIASGPDMSGITDGWQRFAHGWHFNDEGTEASIVLSRAKTISGITFQAFTPTTIEGFEFVMHTMSLVWDYEAKALTYSIVEVSRGDHIPYLQTKVFYPDAFANNLALLTPGYGVWDCWANLSAPLYCYYDNDNKLVKVTVSNTAPTLTPAEITPSGTMDEIMNTPYVSTGQALTVIIPEAHKTEPCGVTVGGTEYKGGSVSYPSPTFRTVWVMKGGYFPGGPTGPEYLAIGEGGGFKNVVRKDSENTATTSICVLPFGDASAVIAGIETRTTGIIASNSLQWFGNNVPLMFPYSTPPYSTRSLWAQYVMLYGADSSTDAALAASDRYAPSSNSIRSNTALHAAGEVIVLAESVRTWNTTLDPGMRPFEGLYNPAGGIAPYYTFPMTVKTSRLGSLQHLFCEPTIDPQKPYVSLFGWPDARWSTSVGWA